MISLSGQRIALIIKQTIYDLRHNAQTLSGICDICRGFGKPAYEKREVVLFNGITYSSVARTLETMSTDKAFLISMDLTVRWYLHLTKLNLLYYFLK